MAAGWFLGLLWLHGFLAQGAAGAAAQQYLLQQLPGVNLNGDLSLSSPLIDGQAWVRSNASDFDDAPLDTVQLKFEFPFFGRLKTRVHVGCDCLGWLARETSAVAPLNLLPSVATPISHRSIQTAHCTLQSMGPRRAAPRRNAILRWDPNATWPTAITT